MQSTEQNEPAEERRVANRPEIASTVNFLFGRYFFSRLFLFFPRAYWVGRGTGGANNIYNSHSFSLSV